MATRTALHLQSSKHLVESLLTDWLKLSQLASVSVYEQPDLPFELYQEKFIVSEEKPPTMLAIGQTQLNWTTVHYNSFYKMRDVAKNISGELRCLAIVALMQSNADANYLSIHNCGEHLRTIEGVASERIKQEGKPLSFETQPLGRKIANQGEEALYVFTDYESEVYCENFGLELWLEEATGWTVLNAPNSLLNNSSIASAKQLQPQKRDLLSHVLRIFGF